MLRHRRAPRTPLDPEAGVSTLEFMGMFLVAGTVVGAIAFTVSGERTASEMGSAFCTITGGGQGCAGGGDGQTTTAAGPTDTCVGAPSGAAGPVRGSVPVVAGAGDTPSLTVSVMGDGTFRVSGPPPDAASTADSWAGRAFGEAAAGVEPYLAGGSPQVWSASSPAGLADLLSADRAQSWSDTVVGDAGGAIARVADAAVGLATDRSGLPSPTALFTDTSAEAGLSLNAYDQTLALDSGGEAVGTLRYDDGSTTEYTGVRESTTGVPRAADVVPMLLEVDRDPAGNVTSVRTVTDRDFTPTGPSTPSGDLYVTHLATDGGSAAPVVADLASAIGSSTLGARPSTGLEGAPVPFATASSGLKSAATANGYVTRQQPAGQVVVDDPNADPVEAGLAQVVRSSPPQAWDGTSWSGRSSGCGS